MAMGCISNILWIACAVMEEEEGAAAKENRPATHRRIEADGGHINLEWRHSATRAFVSVGQGDVAALRSWREEREARRCGGHCYC